MSKNLCCKHEVTPDELNEIIHKLLDKVSVDDLSVKETEVIFDLLRNGDIPADSEMKELDKIAFRTTNFLLGVLPCDNCLVKDVCTLKDNPKAKIINCYTNIAYLMQCFSLSELPELETTKEDVRKAIEQKKGNIFYEMLLSTMGKEDETV